MEVCYKLWEGSWEEDAVVRDRARGVYTEPSKVHDIDHVGKYFTVPGAHLGEPSPQRSCIQRAFDGCSVQPVVAHDREPVVCVALSHCLREASRIGAPVAHRQGGQGGAGHRVEASPRLQPDAMS
jgi:hypothetical protein